MNKTEDPSVPDACIGYKNVRPFPWDHYLHVTHLNPTETHQGSTDYCDKNLSCICLMYSFTWTICTGFPWGP